MNILRMKEQVQNGTDTVLIKSVAKEYYQNSGLFSLQAAILSIVLLRKQNVFPLVF